ncbi:Glycosyltransferase involved in cell wall bisynthesis [Agreia sp. VKM Ac-1783]|nr:Glycosyltransferase involved in cell wall bisynthesis [Agreia sp. VKM Ac-1783]
MVLTGVIVHEWLEPHGGAEKVVEELAAIFPDAPIKALWNAAPERFTSDRVSETWMSRTPLRNHKGIAVPLMPATWRHLGNSDAEWILCSSHLFAHHARFSGPARAAAKYVYAYTPARYIWNPELDKRGSSLPARAVSVPLKRIDRKRAQEPHAIAAISNFVRDRIKENWGRDSTVIYPPVDVEGFISESDELSEREQKLLATLPDTFVLGASRFIPYKRLDLVIDMGIAADLDVVIAGDGPLLGELQYKALEHPRRVTFVRRPSHALLRALYIRSLFYMFPPVEDFGIMPVEAMATGTPVVASAIGGASETVQHGKTGVLLENFSADELREAAKTVTTMKPADCVSRAWAFDRSSFAKEISGWVGS